MPTVKVAERVGYDKVVEMARRAGLNMDIQPTPAVALGSYEVTPLEIAGAYTMFANGGQVLAPYFIRQDPDTDGKTIYETPSGGASRRSIPRVAYLMVNSWRRHSRAGTGRPHPAAGVQPASRRQDRHLARWLVRGFHLGAAVRGLGRL